MTSPTVRVSRAIFVTCSSRASISSLDNALSFSGRFSVSVTAPDSLLRSTRLLMHRISLTIPPAAAERLEQSHGIRVSVGPRLDHGELRLPVALLGIKHGHKTYSAELILALGKIKSRLRGAIRF